jgi:hypothetical protein
MSQSKIISAITTKDILLTTKLPKKTKSYSPVPHKTVIETTLEALDKAGIIVLSELYTSARDGRVANGIYQLQGGDTEMNIRLLWQNSYDKSLPLAAALGAHVIVCKNGMVKGDMGAFKRKHTGTILTEFQESIRTYIDRAGEIFRKMVSDRERMKEITMTRRTTAELVGRMFLEEDIITATQLGIIKREIENPSFNYGTRVVNAEGQLVKSTLWDDYNAVTVSLKEAHPNASLKQHTGLHNFITKDAFKKEFA